MFVDSDDWLELDAVENFSALCDESVDLIVSDFYIENQESTRRISVFTFDHPVRPLGITDLQAMMKSMLRGEKSGYEKTPWAKLYNKKRMNSIGLRFNPKIKGIGEDQVFNLYFFHNAKHALYLNSPTYHYRLRADSISRKPNPFRMEDTILFLESLEIAIHGTSLDSLKQARDVCSFMEFSKWIRHDLADPSCNLSLRTKLSLVRKYGSNTLVATGIKNVRLNDIIKPTIRLSAIFAKMHWWVLLYCTCWILNRTKMKKKKRGFYQ